MNNYKNHLTINNIKMTNQLNEIVPITIFSAMLSSVLLIIPFIVAKYSKTGVDIFVLLGLILLILLPLPALTFLTKKIIKKNREKIYIQKLNFKIVEDEIYDKHSTIFNNYYIFSKIYGKISVDMKTYDNAFKDDYIYLLFYNGDENLENYYDDIDEYKRNLEIINQKFLASKYHIHPELKYNFVPYDKALGEKQLRNRLNNSSAS